MALNPGDLGDLGNQPPNVEAQGAQGLHPAAANLHEEVVPEGEQHPQGPPHVFRTPERELQGPPHQQGPHVQGSASARLKPVPAHKTPGCSGGRSSPPKAPGTTGPSSSTKDSGTTRPSTPSSGPHKEQGSQAPRTRPNGCEVRNSPRARPCAPG